MIDRPKLNAAQRKWMKSKSVFACKIEWKTQMQRAFLRAKIMRANVQFIRPNVYEIDVNGVDIAFLMRQFCEFAIFYCYWSEHVHSFIDSSVHSLSWEKKPDTKTNENCERKKNCNRNTVKMRCVPLNALLSLPLPLSDTHFLSLYGIKSVCAVRVWPSSGSWNFPGSPSNPVQFSSFQLNWIDPQPQPQSINDPLFVVQSVNAAMSPHCAPHTHVTHNSFESISNGTSDSVNAIIIVILLCWMLIVRCVRDVRPYPSPFRTASYMVNNPIHFVFG